MQTRHLTLAFNDLHALACERFGIGPRARGARKRIADELGVTPQQYSDALHGRRRSLETLVDWAKKLGLEVRHQPTGHIQVRPDDSHDVDRALLERALAAFGVSLPEWVRRVRQVDPSGAGYWLRPRASHPVEDPELLLEDILAVAAEHRDHAVALCLAAEDAFREAREACRLLREATNVRPEDDPLFQQLHDKSRVVLIVSVDLVASKSLKRTGPAFYERPWIVTYSRFYEWLPEQMRQSYADLPAGLSDRVGDRRLELLQVDDDDMTFSVEIRHHQDVLVHVRAAMALVEEFNQRNPLGLVCKATAWICGLPITDLEISDRSRHYVAYAGPNMDLGRELRREAAAQGGMPVSLDLAMMLADAADEIPEHGVGMTLDGVTRLAGFPKPYPRILLSLRPAADGEEAANRQELLQHAENLDYVRWFLKAEPSTSPYAGPTLRWLYRYRAILRSREREQAVSFGADLAPGPVEAPKGIQLPLNRSA